MVARISYSKSLHRIVNYNENKVKEDVAMCISAGNYPLDPERMDFNVKLGYMQKQMELNQRAKLTSMHISLNFSPEETDLTKEKLTEIADTYMQGIGFGNQPYLVYQHYDAGHPHIHIVTTTVKRDGKNIDTYMIGKLKSEPIRKSIEKEFGLVRAEDQGKQQQYRPEPISAARVSYGKLETKKSIQNVLEHILSRYKYSSLAELNAVLGLYNILAERGEESSRVFQRGGLLYRVLDTNGNPVGVPIKASSFYSRPTLAGLQQYFDKNTNKSPSHKSRVRAAVDMVLKSKGATLQLLKNELSNKGIDLVFRQNEQGFIYGLTYVDHHTKCVLNGSNLGKAYSAKAIQERCLVSQLEHRGVNMEKVREISRKVDSQNANLNYISADNNWTSDHTTTSFFSQLLDCLIQSEYIPEYIPYELRQQKKKRRKKRRSVNN